MGKHHNRFGPRGVNGTYFNKSLHTAALERLEITEELRSEAPGWFSFSSLLVIARGIAPGEAA